MTAQPADMPSTQSFAGEPPQVPGFEVARQLGRGAHGSVYLARETEGLRRLVALKLFDAQDEQAYVRELDVARVVEGLRDATGVGRLLQALSTGRHEGRGWIALEYMQAGSLHDLVDREGALGWERALRYVREAAEAARVLHGRGLFHRDIKPGNLLLTADDRIRLGDFGLSRSLDGSLSAAGSMGFAAPEVLADKVSDGKRVDVYSLGATLAYLITGERMRPGHPDLFALQRAGASRPLQRLVADAMALEPEQRFATVDAFLQAADELVPEAAAPVAGPTPRWPLVVSAVSVLLALGVVLSERAAPVPLGAPEQPAAQAAQTPDSEALARAGDAAGAARAWLAAVADEDPASPDGAERVARAMLRAQELDWESVSQEAGSAERLRRAGLTIVADVDPADASHAPRVALAHRAFAACRLLDPQRPLPDVVASLRRLGAAPSVEVRQAARPYLAVWSSETTVPAELVERALLTPVTPDQLAEVKAPDLRLRSAPEGVAPPAHCYPVPWETVLYDFRISTNSWGRAYQQRLRYRVLLGWLIERPELTFLHYWAAYEALGLEREDEAIRLARLGAASTDDPHSLQDYANMLNRAGAHEAAVAVAERGIAISKSLHQVHKWLSIARTRSLLELGRAREALEELDGARQFDGMEYHYIYWELRAWALEALGDPRADEARARQRAQLGAQLKADAERYRYRLD